MALRDGGVLSYLLAGRPGEHQRGGERDEDCHGDPTSVLSGGYKAFGAAQPYCSSVRVVQSLSDDSGYNCTTVTLALSHWQLAR